MTDPSHRACRMAKSIATVSLSGTLPEKLEAAAAIGFDGVEIFENDLLTFDGSPEDVRTIADGLGWPSRCFQPFRDFEAMPEPQRTRNLDRAERKFDVMQALGTDLVLVCSNIHPAAIDDDARAAADLAEMAERARPSRPARRLRGAGLGAPRQPMATRLEASCRRRTMQALGLIVDSFHTLAVGDDRIRHRRRSGRQAVLRAARRRAAAVDGCAVLEPAFPQFPRPGPAAGGRVSARGAGRGYRGPLSLEIFNDEFRAAPARLIARDGLRSLLLVEAEAGATTLPPPPTFDGIEFLEFAVDEETGRRLGELLRGPRLPLCRPASLQVGRSVPPGPRQPGAEQRAGQRRGGAFPAARPVGVRDGAAGGRCRGARGSARRRCCAPNGRSASAQASGAFRRCVRRTAR